LNLNFKKVFKLSLATGATSDLLIRCVFNCNQLSGIAKIKGGAA